MDVALIDFDGKLQRDFLLWCTKHADIAKDETRLERAYEAFYQKWYAQPKKWLEGRTPNGYFADIADARMLATLMIEYIQRDMQLPAPLAHEISERAEEMYPLFLNMLMSDETEGLSPDQVAEVQAHAVAFIEELDLPHPYARYIELLLSAEDETDLVDEISAALEADVAGQRAALLDAYQKGTRFASLAILDMLSNLEGDRDVFSLVAARFTSATEQERAVLARCFGKLGLEEALPYLRGMLDREEAYYPYRAALEAWEAITGEEVEEREFAGDPDYDLLAGQQDE